MERSVRMQVSPALCRMIREEQIRLRKREQNKVRSKRKRITVIIACNSLARKLK